MSSCSNAKTQAKVQEIAFRRFVFIVDDDDALVETLTELLRDEGHEVEAHTDVTSALERLKTGFRPDVVLLDYLMPTMTGADFLLELERQKIDVPVMLFTAMNASRVHICARNVRAVIHKPFEFERLLDELAKLDNP